MSHDVPCLPECSLPESFYPGTLPELLSFIKCYQPFVQSMTRHTDRVRFGRCLLQDFKRLAAVYFSGVTSLAGQSMRSHHFLAPHATDQWEHGYANNSVNKSPLHLSLAPALVPPQRSGCDAQFHMANETPR